MNSKKKKISIIFFSYKRAILLDAALASLIKNENYLIKYPIHVIYNYSEEHDFSYKKLLKKYGKKIAVYKRKKIDAFQIFKLIALRPLNFLWALRYASMFKNFTNFKFILEKILSFDDTNFVMLNTDDTIFYNKIDIDKEVFDKVLQNKKDFFYRTNFGLGLKGLYAAKKNSYKSFLINGSNKTKYIWWNSKNKNLNFHMRYHFQVEGAIYHKSTLLNFLKPIIYHNPVTLEAIGYREAKLRNFFTNTIAHKKRSCVTCEINSIQTDTKLRYNYRIQIDPNFMMKVYLEGYELFNLVPNKEKFNSKIIPKNVYVRKINDNRKYKINILNFKNML